MRELSLHILDILQNSIAAGASRITVRLDADTSVNRLTIAIADNGKGMSPEFLRRVRDPFTTTRTTRRVGLGVPMLATAAEICGGSLEIESQPGKGTSVKVSFKLNHIDRAPIGNMADTVIVAIAANPDISFRFEQSLDGRWFVLDTDEIRAQVGDLPINDPAIIGWLKGYIGEGIASIGDIP